MIRDTHYFCYFIFFLRTRQSSRNYLIIYTRVSEGETYINIYIYTYK